MTDYHCTLAKTWDPDKTNVRGWYWSEKLDGVRALWKPELGRFVSRSNKPLNVPVSWLSMMSGVTANLDGEFFMGRGRFSDTVSAVRKKNPSEADFDGLAYVVFDMITSNEVARFDVRLDQARVAIPRGDPRVYVLPHKIVGCMGDMAGEYERILCSGGEGIMFRNPHMKYEFKRSGNLLKWKASIDGTGTVSGMQPGEGKHEGKMGALFIDALYEGKALSFKVGTGFSDEQREAKYPVGTVIRWRGMELTDDDSVRFPVFMCVDEGD